MKNKYQHYFEEVVYDLHFNSFIPCKYYSLIMDMYWL